MAKTKKPYVKFTITGYVPAPNVLDKASFEQFHSRRSQIENLMHDNLEMCEISVKQVNKHVDVEVPNEAAASSEEE